MVMTFGKHKGTPLEHIPPEYLLWVLDTVHDLSPRLRKGIEERLGIKPPTSGQGGRRENPRSSARSHQELVQRRLIAIPPGPSRLE